MDIFPEAIIDAISAFDDKINRIIITSIIAKHELSYIEIKDLLKLDEEQLNSKLEILISGGLIEKADSYYIISSYGERFIDSLFESIEPVCLVDIYG